MIQMILKKLKKILKKIIFGRIPSSNLFKDYNILL